MIQLISSHTRIHSSTTYRIGLFFALVLWYRRRKSLHHHHHCSDEDDDADNDEISRDVGPRGFVAIKKPPSYWNGFLNCLQNPCDLKTKPDGYIALCVAENKLVQEALALRLMQSGTAVAAFSDSIVYCYNGFLGLPHVREAIAYFLERRFVVTSTIHHKTSVPLPSPEIKPEETVDPSNIAIGTGCGSLLSHLFFILGRKGDVVLIPSPYYPGFEYDMKAVAGCIPYPIQMENPTEGPGIHDLDRALQKAISEGLRVKMILITNPNDPLGVIYQPHVILQIIQWARKHNIHTIVDEIYALSVHKKNSMFQSVLKILKNKLDNDVHFLWALSKDFGASGFRIGILYSQNKMLLQALANLNIFSGVSHPMQMIVAELLTDDQFVDAFLEDARRQLIWSYTICTRKLDEMVVPYTNAEAGIFVYVDFSSFLPEQTWHGEKRFAALLQDIARVVMTPGQSHRDSKPGMFRLCYAWVTPDVLEVAMERLSFLILQLRRNHWDDLDPRIFADIMKSSIKTLRRTPSIKLVDLTGNA